MMGCKDGCKRLAEQYEEHRSHRVGKDGQQGREGQREVREDEKEQLLERVHVQVVNGGVGQLVQGLVGEGVGQNLDQEDDQGDLDPMSN